MLSDALKQAYDKMAQVHADINAMGETLPAGTWEHDVELIQQYVYPVGSAGASQDQNFKQLITAMDQDHTWADGLGANEKIDALEVLQTIQGWQKLLSQISTSTLSVMQPYQRVSSVLAPRPYISDVRGGGGTTTTTSSPPPTGLPQGTTTAMATGAGVGAAIVGLMAGLATGEVKYAVGGVLLGAAVGAGAGYYAHNGIPSLK